MSRFHPKDAPQPKPRKVEDSHAFNRNPKMGTRNRLPWTAEEKEALVRGLYKYGVGAWSKIVDDITIASVVSTNRPPFVCLLFVGKLKAPSLSL